MLALFVLTVANKLHSNAKFKFLTFVSTQTTFASVSPFWSFLTINFQLSNYPTCVKLLVVCSVWHFPPCASKWLRRASALLTALAAASADASTSFSPSWRVRGIGLAARSLCTRSGVENGFGQSCFACWLLRVAAQAR